MRKYITPWAIFAGALTGCSSVIDDHSYRPPPDPMALALPFAMLLGMLALAGVLLLVPAVLDHQRKMKELDIRAKQSAVNEDLQIRIAIGLARQMGWPYQMALAHVRTMAQLDAPTIHQMHQRSIAA